MTQSETDPFVASSGMMDPEVVREHLKRLKRKKPLSGERWYWQCTVAFKSKVTPDRASRLKGIGESVWQEGGERR